MMDIYTPILNPSPLKGEGIKKAKARFFVSRLLENDNEGDLGT